MAETGTTLATFLLDKSGSMAAIKYDTMGAFNAYIDTLKKSGEAIEFSLLQFDTNSVDKICVNEPIASAPALSDANYVPNGGTPLIDAAYETIKAVEAAVAGRPAPPKIVICIQTDGEENSSHVHGWHDLTALIKEKTALGWQFNFMGAGIDAYQQGQRMGLAQQNIVSYDHLSPEATRSAFARRAEATASYSRGARPDMAFEPAEKRAAGDRFDPDLSPAKASSAPRGRPGRRSIVDKITLK